MEPLLFEQILQLIAVVGALIIVILLLIINAKKSAAKNKLALEILTKSPDIDEKVLEMTGLKKQTTHESDFRKGALLLVIGSVITALFASTGGNGWILGLIPVFVGVVYLGFWFKTKPE